MGECVSHLDSDIIYFRPFGTPVIILNSAKAAYDLFERRSALYSDRCVDVGSLLPVDLTGSMLAIEYIKSWQRNCKYLRLCANVQSKMNCGL